MSLKCLKLDGLRAIFLLNCFVSLCSHQLIHILSSEKIISADMFWFVLIICYFFKNIFFKNIWKVCYTKSKYLPGSYTFLLSYWKKIKAFWLKTGYSDVSTEVTWWKKKSRVILISPFFRWLTSFLPKVTGTHLVNTTFIFFLPKVTGTHLVNTTK